MFLFLTQQEIYFSKPNLVCYFRYIDSREFSFQFLPDLSKFHGLIGFISVNIRSSSYMYSKVSFEKEKTVYMCI